MYRLCEIPPFRIVLVLQCKTRCISDFDGKERMEPVTISTTEMGSLFLATCSALFAGQGAGHFFPKTRGLWPAGQHIVQMLAFFVRFCPPKHGVVCAADIVRLAANAAFALIVDSFYPELLSVKRDIPFFKVIQLRFIALLENLPGKAVKSKLKDILVKVTAIFWGVSPVFPQAPVKIHSAPNIDF